MIMDIKMKFIEIVKVNLIYAWFVNVMMWWYNFYSKILVYLLFICFSCASQTNMINYLVVGFYQFLFSYRISTFYDIHVRTLERMCNKHNC
jgi:hypothetical protein